MPVSDEHLTQRIFSAVETGFTEQIAFTQELIRYPSLRGQEHTAQDFLYRELARRKYAMDRWAIDVNAIASHPGFSPVTVNYDNAINVVASHRPHQESGRSLILNGHVDVVPTGPESMWSHPPFEPVIAGDWLYGRGGGDMKAGLAANIFALDALRRLELQPAATVYIQSVTEEECTGNGALACLVRGYKAAAALIPEPMNEQLVRANVGVIWFRVHVSGKPVHVADAGSGANAIEAAYRLIQALRKLEQRWNEQQHQHRYFADLNHPINLNIGKIAGGDWASSVPAWCSFDCRIALYPGIDPKTAARDIENCIRTASREDSFLANNPPEIEYNGFLTEGYVLEEGSEAEQVLSNAHAQCFKQTLQSSVSPAYLDARVFVLYDDCPCLVYGPQSEDIHGYDERVSINSIKEVTKTIALFIADWCGLEPITKP